MRPVVTQGRTLKERMPLITVFFRYEETYARAIVDEKQVEFFLEMGAKRTPKEVLDGPNKKVPEVPDKKENEIHIETNEEKTKLDGDKGSGLPNSIRFHQLKIDECEDFESIRDYTFLITGKMIRKKRGGTIDRYRKNAMRLIKGHVNGSESR